MSSEGLQQFATFDAGWETLWHAHGEPQNYGFLLVSVFDLMR